MSRALLPLVWLAGSLIAFVYAATRLPAQRDRALQLENSEFRRRTLGRLDAVSAVISASLVAALAYLAFGVVVPAVVDTWTGLFVEPPFVAPILAFAAMVVVSRLAPSERPPSWRVYGTYLLSVGTVLVVLLVVPVALKQSGIQVWVYPLLLFLACLATMFQAYRKATHARSKPTGLL